MLVLDYLILSMESLTTYYYRCRGPEQCFTTCPVQRKFLVWVFMDISGLNIYSVVTANEKGSHLLIPV